MSKMYELDVVYCDGEPTEDLVIEFKLRNGWKIVSIVENNDLGVRYKVYIQRRIYS